MKIDPYWAIAVCIHRITGSLNQIPVKYLSSVPFELIVVRYHFYSRLTLIDQEQTHTSLATFVPSFGDSLSLTPSVACVMNSAASAIRTSVEKLFLCAVLARVITCAIETILQCIKSQFVMFMNPQMFDYLHGKLPFATAIGHSMNESLIESFRWRWNL